MATLGLLNTQQSIFVDKVSQLVVRESTDIDETSSDDEFQDKRFLKSLLQIDRAVLNLSKSKKKVDKRLANLYLL